MSLKYKKKLIPLAKMMRKNMTRHEKHLWYDFLNKYPTRFQRQKTIGGYIADFYCHKAKLVVELDGTQHYENKAIEYDAERTETFESLGIKVLRILNMNIDKDFENVCRIIDVEVKERLSL